MVNTSGLREKKSIGLMSAGEEGIVIKIRGAASLHRYLYKLGIVAGIAITRVRNHGPLISGNPIPFRVRDNMVYLSEEIARCIQVAVYGKETARFVPGTNLKTVPERGYYPLDSVRPAVNAVNI